MKENAGQIQNTLKKQIEGHSAGQKFWQAFSKDMGANSITSRAASMALFSMISLFPIVAIMVWIVSFYGLQKQVSILFSDVRSFVPSELTQLITGEIKYRSDHRLSGNWYALLLHLFILLLSGGSAARSLLKAFQAIGQAETKKWVFSVFGRSIALVLTLIIFAVFLSLVGGIIFVAFTFLIDAFKLSWFTVPLQWLFMTAMLSLTMNAVYRWSLFGSQHKRLSGWHGAVTAAALIAFITIILAAYNHFDPSNSARYGTYGAIRNILLWLYACSIAVLIGAQVNATRYNLSNL